MHRFTANRRRIARLVAALRSLTLFSSSRVARIARLSVRVAQEVKLPSAIGSDGRFVIAVDVTAYETWRYPLFFAFKDSRGVFPGN